MDNQQTDSSQADPRQEAIAELLWDYLKKDPEHADRRMTGYGSKTKQGLFLSVLRAAEPHPTPPTLEQAAAAFIEAACNARPIDIVKAANQAKANSQDFALPAGQRILWPLIRKIIYVAGD